MPTHRFHVAPAPRWLRLPRLHVRKPISKTKSGSLLIAFYGLKNSLQPLKIDSTQKTISWPIFLGSLRNPVHDSLNKAVDPWADWWLTLKRISFALVKNKTPCRARAHESAPYLRERSCVARAATHTIRQQRTEVMNVCAAVRAKWYCVTWLHTRHQRRKKVYLHTGTFC